MLSGDKLLLTFKKKHIIYCSFFIAITCLITTTNAKPDQRLDVFIQQFDKLENKRLPLDHPDNPFHLYTKTRFEDGLSPNDKAEFLKSQKQGHCFEVDQLVIKGFKRLYPFLKPAFDTPKRSGDLIFMINHGYQDPTTRCIAHKLLNGLKKRVDLAQFPSIDMKREIEQTNKRAKLGKPETDRDVLIGIHFRLGKTAFCNDYLPSINDLISTANKPGGMKLTPDEELYLVERANDRGEHKIPSIKGFWRKVCNTLRHKK